MANVITLAMLIEKKACEKQVNLFQEYFGESVEITEEVCLKYYDKFNVVWLIHNMLNDEQREAYQAIESPALKAYRAIEVPAWEAHQAIVVPAYKALEAMQSPALKDYLTIKESAWKAYEAIVGRAWRSEAYKKEKARAFWLAYNS